MLNPISYALYSNKKQYICGRLTRKDGAYETTDGRKEGEALGFHGFGCVRFRKLRFAAEPRGAESADEAGGGSGGG